MTFEYNAFADTLLVSISEPQASCVYSESQTPGVLLRIEQSTGIVRSFEVFIWSRRIANGMVLVPEVNDPTFESQWVSTQKNTLISMKGKQTGRSKPGAAHEACGPAAAAPW